MIGIFCDVPNIFFNCKKKFNGRLNYQKLYDQIKEMGQITRAYAYGFQIEKEASPFIFCLRKIGFDCKWQTLVKYNKGGEERFKHVDFGVMIAMDVVRNIDRFHTLVLVSNDLNLEPLIQWATERGVKVVVVGARLPAKLKAAANQWIEIKEELIDRNDETPS